MGNYGLYLKYQNPDTSWSAGFYASFKYQLDPCATARFSTVSGTAVTNPFYIGAIGTAYAVQSSIVFLTDVSGCALKNTFTTSPSFSKLTATVLSDGSAVISVASTTVSGEEGDYTISINSCIELNSLECTTQSFTVSLSMPCQTTVVTASTIPDVSLAVWDAGIFYRITGFTDFDPATGSSNQCTIVYSFSY